ncbi:MAG: DUF350 domain-containing protein [Acidimicrobiales bacterium]
MPPVELLSQVTSPADSLAEFPAFLAALGVAGAALLVFGALYTLVTPWQDWGGIGGGNTAKAVVFGGALVGFAVPLAAAAAHSADWFDMSIWAAIALVLQLAVNVGARLALPRTAERITANDSAHAVLLASLSLAVGVVMLGCMTP